ncbi:MAG: nucleoside-diphosphate sugar epimerase [Geminicoccaceae bacterium]|nr:MAG: nucleoside-diphosphate sugar epimerase [Geminicoccaceae bacterium]
MAACATSKSWRCVSAEPEALVWGLLDDRIGHQQQVRGVVRALGAPHRLIDLHYRLNLGPCDQLPLGLILHLTAETRARLQPPWPDLVVAAGRRTAPVARWIKRASGGHSFLVQLMRPARLQGLDLVAIPAHDAPPTRGNVVATLGAPHPFDRASLDAAKGDLPAGARALPPPRFAVLVGGPSGSVRFDAHDEARLIAELSALAAVARASLLITTSRRTPERLASALVDALAAPRFVHRFDGTAQNPLRAFLGAADRVVVTADSASMLSEAAATGRPVHVFRPRHLPAKLRHLVDALTAAGYVQPWHADLPPTPPPLDEAKRLARLIHARAGPAKPTASQGQCSGVHEPPALPPA